MTYTLFPSPALVRSSRRDPPRNLWRGGARLRVLGPGSSRGRAGGRGIPVRDERPVVARDASHPCLGQRGASTEISSGARHRGENRLFRAHRARRRFRPCRHRSEEHTSELQSLMRISYAVFCLKKKKKRTSK